MTGPSRQQKINAANAGLLRRIAALMYDGFLILAIWMISSILLIALVTNGAVLQGLAFQLFLYLQLGAFYIYFWCKRGQTLGMQAWRIHLITEQGNPVPVKTACTRYIFATLSVCSLGIGFLWMLVNSNRLSLHDLATDTRVVHLPKNS